jgi:hypothetical protein
VFYTTPTDDGAIAVTCDLCFASVGCPDPWAVLGDSPVGVVGSLERH